MLIKKKQSSYSVLRLFGKSSILYAHILFTPQKRRVSGELEIEILFVYGKACGT